MRFAPDHNDMDLIIKCFVHMNSKTELINTYLSGDTSTNTLQE
jgi:hypothetical protein